MDNQSLKIYELVPDPNNANKHTERGIGLVDTIELARHTGYTRYYIYVLIKKRKLPHHRNKDGRICFVLSEIDKWLLKNPRVRISEKAEVICNGCGKKFFIHNYRIGKAGKYYCSTKCRKTARHIKCDFCRINMVRIPAQIEKYNFCSRICMGKYHSKYRSGENSKLWTGKNKKNYGSSWIRQRNRARERDNYTCQLCGKKETTKHHDVHHKRPFALFGHANHKKANALSNLITLCGGCHSKVEPRFGKNNKQK